MVLVTHWVYYLVLLLGSKGQHFSKSGARDRNTEDQGEFWCPEKAGSHLKLVTSVQGFGAFLETLKISILSWKLVEFENQYDNSCKRFVDKINILHKSQYILQSVHAVLPSMKCCYQNTLLLLLQQTDKINVLWWWGHKTTLWFLAQFVKFKLADDVWVIYNKSNM